MTIEDVKQLMNKIYVIYGSKFKIEDPKEMVNIWFEVLSRYDKEFIFNNLKKHLEQSSFPPTPSELIRKDAAELSRTAIPSYEDSMMELQKRQTVNEPVNPEVYREAKEYAMQQLEKAKLKMEERKKKYLGTSIDLDEPF